METLLVGRKLSGPRRVSLKSTQIWRDRHEGARHPGLYAGYIRCAGLCAAKRNPDVQRQCVRRTVGATRGLRAIAGLRTAADARQTENVSSRQAAHAAQAYGFIATARDRLAG